MEIAPIHKYSLLPALIQQTRCEILKLIRVPIFIISTLLFPIMFFALFGLPNAGERLGGIDAGAYILVSYGAYSVISTAIFSFGVPLANERSLGWNKLMRTTPMRPSLYFIAKIITALSIGLIAMTALFLFGGITGKIALSFMTWVSIALRLIASMAPFIALGLIIGYISGPTSAPAIANLVFLPMSFASGILVPLQAMPKFIQDIAPYLPAYHAGELARGALLNTSATPDLLWLLGYTIFFLMVAFWAYRHDEGKAYG